MRCPQGGDFAAPAGKVVLGRFQEEGQIAQGRVVRHSGERIKADAALAASLFHYKELEIREVKEYLAGRNVPVRL